MLNNVTFSEKKARGQSLNIQDVEFYKVSLEVDGWPECGGEMKMLQRTLFISRRSGANLRIQRCDWLMPGVPGVTVTGLHDVIDLAFKQLIGQEEGGESLWRLAS